MLPLMHMGKHVKLDTFLGNMQSIQDRVNLKREANSTQQLAIRAIDANINPKLQQPSIPLHPDVPLQGNRYAPGRIGSSAASMPRVDVYNNPNTNYSQQPATSDSNYPIYDRSIEHSQKLKHPVNRGAEDIGKRYYIGHNGDDGILSKVVNKLSPKSATNPIAKISVRSKVTSQMPATIFSKQDDHPISGIKTSEHRQSQSKSARSCFNKESPYTAKSSDPKLAPEWKLSDPKPLVMPQRFQHLSVKQKAGGTKKVPEERSVLSQTPHRSDSPINNHGNLEQLDKQNLFPRNYGSSRPTTGTMVANIRTIFQQSCVNGPIVSSSKPPIRHPTKMPALKQAPNTHLGSVSLVRQANKSKSNNAWNVDPNADPNQSSKTALTPLKANHTIVKPSTPRNITQGDATPPPHPKHARSPAKRPGAAVRTNPDIVEVRSYDNNCTDGITTLNQSSPVTIRKVWESNRISNSNPFVRQIRTQGKNITQYSARTYGSNRSPASKDTVIQVNNNTIPQLDLSVLRHKEEMCNLTTSPSQSCKNDEIIKTVSEAATVDNSAVRDVAGMGLDTWDGSKNDSPIQDLKLTDIRTRSIPVQRADQETICRETAELPIYVPGTVNTTNVDINGNKTVNGNDLRNSVASENYAIHKSSIDDSCAVQRHDKEQMVSRHSEPHQVIENVEGASTTHTSNPAASSDTDAVPTISDVSSRGTIDNGNSPDNNKILNRPKQSIQLDHLDDKMKHGVASEENLTVVTSGSNDNGKHYSEPKETDAAVQHFPHSKYNIIDPDTRPECQNEPEVQILNACQSKSHDVLEGDSSLQETLDTPTPTRGVIQTTIGLSNIRRDNNSNSKNTTSASSQHSGQQSVDDAEASLQDNSVPDDKLPIAVSNNESQVKSYMPNNDPALDKPSDAEYDSPTNDVLSVKISPRGAHTTTSYTGELHSELHSTNKDSGTLAFPVDDPSSSARGPSNVQTEEIDNSDQVDVPQASSLPVSTPCLNDDTLADDEAAINPSDIQMSSAEITATEQSVVDAGEQINLPNSEENGQMFDDAQQHESPGLSPGKKPEISDDNKGQYADSHQKVNIVAGYVDPAIAAAANHAQSSESCNVEEEKNLEMNDNFNGILGPTYQIPPTVTTLTSSSPDATRSEYFMQPVLQTDPIIIEQNIISKLLVWVEKQLDITNVELMLENVDVSTTNGILAENLAKFQDIVRGLNVDLRNMFDNYVCFDGERDRSQMKRFIQTAIKRASERWESNGLNGTCLTLNILEAARNKLIKVYCQHNEQIIETERQQIKNVVCDLTSQYERMFQHYMQVGSNKFTTDELEDIHRRMRSQCAAILGRATKYGGKLNNIMREATIQMTKSLNDHFEQQIKLHFLHIDIPSFSNEQGQHDRKLVYSNFMKEQMEAHPSISPTDLKQKHDIVIKRVTNGMSRTEEEELKLLLDTRFLFAMEDYDYRNKSMSGHDFANILGLYLTPQWVYVLAYTPELGCKRITFPCPNGRIQQLPALLASAGEYFSWGFEAFKVITEQKDRLDQHGYLVHFITRDAVGSTDDNALVTKFIHETTAAVERGVKVHFDGVVLVVPCCFTFEHRHRVRDCCNEVDLEKVIMLTDTSLISCQVFKALPRHDERSASPIIAVVTAHHDAVRIEIFEGVSSGDEKISARLLAVATEVWPFCEDNGGYSSLKRLTSDCLETVKATYGRVLAQVQMNQRQSICYYAVNSERSDWETSLDDFLRGEEKLTKVEATGDLFSEIFSSFCTDPSKLSKFLGVMATSIINDSTGDDDEDDQMQVDEEFIRRKNLLLEKCDKMETQITEGVVSIGRLTTKIIMEAIRMGRLAAEEDMIEGAEAREVEELFQLHNFN